MYCLQQWYALADEALEDAIYDSQALRNFVGIDLSRESVPDATTLLGFHLLEANGLTKMIFETVNRHLRERGLLLNKGTLTDATILAAPSSTKNKEKARDPQMHQTRKGKQWYFGMKAHIGADADSGLVHTVWAPPPTSPTSPRPSTCCMEKRRSSSPTPATSGPTSAKRSETSR